MAVNGSLNRIHAVDAFSPPPMANPKLLDMILMGKAIPDFLWLPILTVIGVWFIFAGRAHRKTLLNAAAREGAGENEANALKRQRLGMVAMAALLGVIAMPFLVAAVR